MSGSIDELLEIMAALRDPETGCPWDVKQDFRTIAPYTIEEAYEVDDAIRRGDMEELREELGDLLLQVVFHAQMAREAGIFSFEDVVAAICSKMTERHPHVFEQPKDVSEIELRDVWESQKESERRRKGSPGSALDGVARALPALMRSQKLIKRAARKGFRWSSPEDAFTKCREELGELQQAVAGNDGRDHVEEEMGDLLFASVAIACQHGLDAEKALRRANDKFENRFRRLEESLEEDGRNMADLSVEDLVSRWRRSRTAPS